MFKNGKNPTKQHEALKQKMEKEGPDALEVAAQEDEKGKKKEKGQAFIMTNTLTKEKLDKYFSITKEALEKAGSNLAEEKKTLSFKPIAKEFLDMAQRYFDDAGHFYKKGDAITAFAALNYAHGWLDAGARLKLFKVKDPRLFAAD